MIAWADVEDALRAWVVAATGLPDGSVIWAAQGGPRPDVPFATLQISSVRAAGRDWLDVEDNPSPTAGSEILHRARGTREAALTIQVFAADAIGAQGAAALLERLPGACRLPTVAAALEAAGVGIARFEQVLVAGSVLDSSTWEPRAAIVARVFLASEVSEAGTYIEFVELEREAPPPAGSTYVPEDPT